MIRVLPNRQPQRDIVAARAAGWTVRREAAKRLGIHPSAADDDGDAAWGHDLPHRTRDRSNTRRMKCLIAHARGRQAADQDRGRPHHDHAGSRRDAPRQETGHGHRSRCRRGQAADQHRRSAWRHDRQRQPRMRQRCRGRRRRMDGCVAMRNHLDDHVGDAGGRRTHANNYRLRNGACPARFEPRHCLMGA